MYTMYMNVVRILYVLCVYACVRVCCVCIFIFIYLQIDYTRISLNESIYKEGRREGRESVRLDFYHLAL